MAYTGNFPVEPGFARTATKEEATPVAWGGKPLRSTLLFLSMPGGLMLATTLFGLRLPSPLLYILFGAIGIFLVIRCTKDPEWLLASFALYIPLSKMIVASVAPGINGTNAFLALGIATWIWQARLEKRPMFRKLASTQLVMWYAIVTSFSGITVMFTPGGVSYLIEDMLLEYKGWIDQFLIFFIFVNLIKDGAMARRVALYLCLGYLFVLVLGVQEMLDKMGMSTIEKSRVLGPQLQPNDFGAFLDYGIGPLMGLALLAFTRIRSWALLPVFGVVVKVLLSTFSRGAYLGLGLAAAVATYVRGKRFVFLGIFLAAVVVVTLPQLIPSSLVARMSQTEVAGGERLDESSQTRLILWRAAIDMTLESPIFGKGFKNFRRLKSKYTEYPVRESDNHNMFLFISSQMGIPALILFLMLIYRMYRHGRTIADQNKDLWARAIGIGGAAMAGAVFAVNMFGSRMVNISVCGYVWIYFAVLLHLLSESEAGGSEEPPVKTQTVFPSS